MHPVVRSTLAIVLGLATAFVVVAAVESLGHLVYPPPPGLDPNKIEEFRAHLARLPLGAFLFVLGAWMAGALSGGLVASVIAGRRHALYAGLVGAFVLCGSAAMLLMLPHPTWFAAAAIVGVPAAAALAAVLGRALCPAKPPARAGLAAAWFAASAALAGGALCADDAPRFAFVADEASLAARLDGRPLATYVWKDPKIRRPFFAHVHAPDGQPLTRRQPPVAGQDAVDHADMHPGIWLSFGDLGGGDFWRNKAAVEHLGFVDKPSARGAEAGWIARHRYLVDGAAVCEETLSVRLAALPAGVLLRWESTFASDREFAFGDQEEMGLGVRVATPLTVAGGDGLILNSAGQRDEKQVWGRVAAWCAYQGAGEAARRGVLLMPHPDNFRPCWFHARDYGLLVANPFGRNAFTRGEASRVVVRPGERFRLRFGVLLFSEPPDHAAIRDEYLRLAKP